MTKIRRHVTGVLVAVCILFVAACVESGPTVTPESPEKTQPTKAACTPTDSDPSQSSRRAPKAPPPVTICFFDQSAELEPWSYCYEDGCASGSPPENPIDVGSPDEVVVNYPLPDWSFKAFFAPADEKCGRVQRVHPERVDDGELLLRPAGYADTYDVTLFGRGDGDVSTTFRWTTPSDGPLPRPQARAAIVSDEGNQIVSYGVELSITNLARDPKKAKATITVTADNGDSISFRAKQTRTPCRAEGSLYFDRPDDKGMAAADLGGAPFMYDIRLVLDGKSYRARAVWPDDEIKGNEPSVHLRFAPPLPRLGG